MAVAEAEAGVGEAATHGAQHARLADPRLAGEQDVLALVHGGDHLIDDVLSLGSWASSSSAPHPCPAA